MSRIYVAIAIVLAFVILFVPAYILWLTWSGYGGSPPDGLLTLNTKDSTRLAAPNPAALSIASSHALFPDGTPATANGAVVVPANDWHAAVAAAPLLRWVNGPLLLDDGSGTLSTEIARLQVKTVTGVGTSIPAASANLQGSNGPELAASVDAMVTRLAGSVHPNIILVPEDPAYAIPAAYWAAQFGDVILFGGNPLPEATRRALVSRDGQAKIYAIGSDASDLRQYGTVRLVAAGDSTSTAVAIAEYHDDSADAGWGIDASRYDANHNFVLANRTDPLTAAAGLSLARFGKFGPLLWVERDALPAATAQYLWKMKPEYFKTPAEGPFNHLWILGGIDKVSVQTQGKADLSQEIEAYRFEGAGLSGMETLWVVWVVVGIASGIWLLVHSSRRMPQMSNMMRASWTLLGLVLGPIALVLYRLLYHRVPWMKHGDMTMWHRQGFGPALAAAAMNRGFDGPLMIVISWIVTFLGLPLVVFRGLFFWLGNSMMVGIFIAYFGALLLHWLAMHALMFMRHERLSYGPAVRKAFEPAFLSMTAMAVGMMGFMWWIQMINLMMEGMPEADDIMWWGTTLAAILVGLLVALPVDAYLVRRHPSLGSM